MPPSLELRADAQRSLAFGSIGAAYAPVGSAFTRPCRILQVLNLTNGLLQFSFDGVVDHFVLPAGGMEVLDVTTNDIQTAGWFISIGTRIYVKRIDTPTSGSVYISVYYARGS